MNVSLEPVKVPPDFIDFSLELVALPPEVIEIPFKLVALMPKVVEPPLEVVTLEPFSSVDVAGVCTRAESPATSVASDVVLKLSGRVSVTLSVGAVVLSGAFEVDSLEDDPLSEKFDEERPFA